MIEVLNKMNRFYCQPPKKIPINGNFDVIVVGGGPAGIIAAITSARRGCKTLLIEKNGFLGGTITASLVVNWIGAFTKEDFDLRRPSVELMQRILEKNSFFNLVIGKNQQISFSPEIFKDISLRMVEKAKVKLLLHTYAVDVIREKNNVKGVIIEGKSGRLAFLSRIVIDATGDGDIAFFSGVNFYSEPKSKRLPLTLIFRVGGVDTGYCKKIFYSYLDKNIDQKCKWKLNKFNIKKVSIFCPFQNGEVFVNMTKIKADALNLHDLTKACIKARKQIYKIHEFLKRYVPGFSKSYIIDTAPQIGVRETRRIKGLYTLNQRDIFKVRKDEDFIIPSGFFISKNNSVSQFYIPYRCLIPKNVDNLLVAGRCISTSHNAFLYTRNISTCMSLGEASSIAASICCKKNILPRNLDIDIFNKALNNSK